MKRYLISAYSRIRIFISLLVLMLVTTIVTTTAVPAVHPANMQTLKIIEGSPYEGLRRTMVCETHSGPLEWRTDGVHLYMGGEILEPSHVIGTYQITVSKNPTALAALYFHKNSG